MSRDDRRWLIVGGRGMLGVDVVAALAGRDVTAVGSAELDVRDPAAALEGVDGYDVVVNCSAWTAVDDAEAHEAEAFAVNAVGPANLARACARTGSWLVHVSTDYVFAGDATTPYSEDSPSQPQSAYGRTKAAGEWAVRAELPDRSLIVRTAWLYGAHGPNFVKTMQALEASRESLDVVDDQRGQPTWSTDLAERLVAAVDVGAPAGIYHGTASGETTWFGFASGSVRRRPTSSPGPLRDRPTPCSATMPGSGPASARCGRGTMRSRPRGPSDRPRHSCADKVTEWTPWPSSVLAAAPLPQTSAPGRAAVPMQPVAHAEVSNVTGSSLCSSRPSRTSFRARAWSWTSRRPPR